MLPQTNKNNSAPMPDNNSLEISESFEPRAVERYSEFASLCCRNIHASNLIVNGHGSHLLRVYPILDAELAVGEGGDFARA